MTDAIERLRELIAKWRSELLDLPVGDSEWVVMARSLAKNYNCALNSCADELEALLARTEAGADGVSIWRYRFRNSETGGWHEWRYSEQEPVLNSFVADKTETQGPFTHPQDASGDAEDARRYRWLKDRSTRKSVMDSAKQNGPFIAIGSPLSGFHVPLDIDSAVDTAKEAK